jgi:hypothetical protein
MTTAEAIVAAITEALEGRVDRVTEETHRRMGDAVPALDIAARPELSAVVERSSRASFDVMMAALRAGRPPAAMPPEGLAEARVCARLGIPVEELLQTYRVAHAQLWETAIEHVEAASGAPAEARADALRVFARVVYGYLDLASATLPEVHRQAAAEHRSAAAGRRLDAVRAVLQGAEDELRGIAYDLRRDHVALVAWGDEPTHGVAAACPDAATLTVAVEERLAWAWTSGAVRGEVPLPPGTALAVGEPGRGPGGFRRSHAQARRAHAVGVRTGAPVSRYRDCALEALAVADPASAEAFARAELGPLLGSDAHAERLRETLAATSPTARARPPPRPA